MPIVTSKDWKNQTCILVTKDGDFPIMVGQSIEQGKNVAKIIGGRAPHNPGSSGKVWLARESVGFVAGELYPGVLNLYWKVKKENT